MRRRTATPDIKVLEKTKTAPDIDIVPPISVLIVEGMFFWLELRFKKNIC
jgi:uridine kinase